MMIVINNDIKLVMLVVYCLFLQDSLVLVVFDDQVLELMFCFVYLGNSVVIIQFLLFICYNFGKIEGDKIYWFLYSIMLVSFIEIFVMIDVVLGKLFLDIEVKLFVVVLLWLEVIFFDVLDDVIKMLVNNIVIDLILCN